MLRVRICIDFVILYSRGQNDRLCHAVNNLHNNYRVVSHRITEIRPRETRRLLKKQLVINKQLIS